MKADQVDVVELADDQLSSSSLNVLLVEDDEGDAYLVRELLIDAGSQVDLLRARSVAEASAALPGRVDCVLLDLGLPDASGLDALTAVLQLAPSIAVLVLTGLSDEHRGTEAVAVGAQDYLVKGGLDGPLLMRAIRYAVERKRADESLRRLFASEARAAENARLERGLLPEALLRSGRFRVEASYRPGRHQSLLGGDFYDVVECDDGTVFALIGDVAGHGPDEAALGVCLRIAWRTLILSGTDPDRILPAMDAVLVSERSADEVFATVAMVRVDPSAGRLRIWRAGHPLPLVVDSSRVHPVPEGDAGIALGILDDNTWDGVEHPVAADGTIALFTDGLLEGYDGATSGRRLGEAGLYALVESLLARGLGGDELLHTLLAQVRERNGGELSDDVAVVLLSWHGR
jgi:serine phosphatase RsbU (regulator of sigma subunit)